MNKTRPIFNFLFIVAAFFTASYSSNAQTPSWEWVKKSIGSSYIGSRCIDTDSNGNIYSAGTYTTSTLNFDNLTITNLSSSSSNLREGYVVKHNSAGTAEWLLNIGGTGEEQIFDITTDSDNNIYITGDFDSPTLTFGSTVLTNSGNQDVFLAKFDSNGTPLWAKAITGLKYDYGFSLTVDSSNNVYVGGNFFSDTIDVSGITLTNVEAGLAAVDHDVFFAKYDSNGTALWAKSAGGTGYDNFTSIKTDPAGNVYVTGYFYSPSITFGTTILYNTNGYGDIFLAKYNANGVFQWAKRAGGTNYDNVRSMKADANGNVYITGNFESPSLTFGTTTLTNSGSSKVFLTKYNTNGTVVWARGAGNLDSNIAQDLDIDSNGNIFITGAYGSSIAFGTLPTHTTQGSYDIFICKYDADGEALWSKSNGGTGYEMSMGISCGPNNQISTTGYSGSASIVFDNTTINATGGSHFVTKIPGTVLGTEDFKTEQFSIFPNPVKNHLFLTKADALNGSNYSIIDINGRTVLNGKISGTNPIETTSLESGFYSIQIEDGAALKFIKE